MLRVIMEIHKFNSIPNTNSLLIEESKKGAKTWTVYWTDNQTAGRGYTGNSWQVEPYKNLQISVLIKSELDYKDLFFFNQWVCNCIYDLLAVYTDDVNVKWPNDIIIKGKKVCGILIETNKSKEFLNIITGIGLNVNQTDYSNFPKGGSMATQTGRQFELEEVLNKLLQIMFDSYVLIENKDWESIRETYNSRLFRRNIMSQFKKDGKIFRGKILDIDDNGSLRVETEDGMIRSFMHKEVELIY